MQMQQRWLIARQYTVAFASLNCHYIKVRININTQRNPFGNLATPQAAPHNSYFIFQKVVETQVVFKRQISAFTSFSVRQMASRCVRTGKETGSAVHEAASRWFYMLASDLCALTCKQTSEPQCFPLNGKHLQRFFCRTQDPYYFLISKTSGKTFPIGTM